MSSLQFRASAERVSAFRQLLSNSVLAEALVVLKDEKPLAAVAPNADPMESVRLLARLQQHEADVNLLLSLAEPLPVEPEEEEATFGIDRTKFASTS